MGNSPTPSIGRVVHYVAYGTPGGEYAAGAHRAALITAVNPQDATRVSIVIFNPTGLFFLADAVLDMAAAIPGTWHWPEYVA